MNYNAEKTVEQVLVKGTGKLFWWRKASGETTK
jgi:hypothetical protein